MPRSQARRKRQQGVIDSRGAQAERKGPAAPGCANPLGLGAQIEGHGLEPRLPRAAQGEALGFRPDRWNERDIGALCGNQRGRFRLLELAGDPDRTCIQQARIIRREADNDEFQR